MNRLKQYLDDEEPLSTGKQRAHRRAFDRERRLEEKADRRPWEED